MHSTHSSSRILLPARPGFILFSMLLMYFMNLMFSKAWMWVPDWMALALIFWSIREPKYVGLGVAFVSGVLMDVADASLMGQHALAYVIVSYAAFRFSKRILRFPLKWQALQILPFLLIVQLIQFGIRFASGDSFSGWNYFIGPFVGTAFWWPLAHILLLPQYQPAERDENRPI